MTDGRFASYEVYCKAEAGLREIDHLKNQKNLFSTYHESLQNYVKS